ncbi:hypothetical protein, partial [Haliea salexigens]|uniref:hypothetical protein n=1 Tax=Haliea salexigens TaxID=287487 RepID=UPI00196A16E7
TSEKAIPSWRPRMAGLSAIIVVFGRKNPSTPGYVKQSVLKQTLKEGSQIILFLTHDEIKGVEEILDKYAGTVYTLTNPAHYPRMLKNEPDVKDARVVRCECNHRKECSICERKDAGV